MRFLGNFWTKPSFALVENLRDKLMVVNNPPDHYQQEFQVPKMEVLNLIRLFWGWVFPYISLTYSLYIGEYLHFGYLKCSVTLGFIFWEGCGLK